MVFDNAHALAIGISRYQLVAPLRPTQDADDVAAVLMDPDICCYPRGNVRLLLEAQATRAAILNELDALAGRIDSSSSVFLYFSGHGARAAGDSQPSYYLVPVDGKAGQKSDLESTAISGQELSARLDALAVARLTVVLDCCRAAALTDPELGFPAAELSSQALGPLARGHGRAVLAASRADGSAFTMPGDTHSIFTGHLLRGLRGEAAHAGGVIRICDLFHYVQQATTAEQLRQRPVFKAELEENYPVALARGGVVAPLQLPPPPDPLPYDAYISYCQDDASDRAWTSEIVVPFLESNGLRLCLEDRDFRLGASRIRETERAVTESRYTVAVLTPAYFGSGFSDYQGLLAAHSAAESHLPRFIPLLRKPCQLTLHERMTAILNVTSSENVPAALARLALALRQPLQPRLSP